MSDSRDDLRSTQRAIRQDAEQLVDLEDEKAAHDPGDPRVSAMSEQVERIASDLKNKTAAERELSEDTSGR